MSLPPLSPGAPPRAEVLSSATWDAYVLRLKLEARR
jgi:hypothetical protein